MKNSFLNIRIISASKICLLLCMLYSAEGIAQVNNIQVKFSKDTALIGDYLLLKLDVSYKNGDVFFPVLKDSLGNGFEVLQSAKEVIKEQNGLKNKSMEYTMIQFDQGSYQFAPLSFLYRNASGQLDTIYSNAFRVVVKTIPIDTLAEIKAAKPIYFPPHQFKEFLPILAGVVGLLCLIALLFYVWKKNRKPIKVEVNLKPEDIYEITLKELQKLYIAKDWTKDKSKEHHLKLTEIIRTYLEIRFAIQALESTSKEIMDALKDKKSHSVEHMELLREILEHCDLVKFAKWIPNEAAAEKIMDASILYVQQTKPIVIVKEQIKK